MFGDEDVLSHSRVTQLGEIPNRVAPRTRLWNCFDSLQGRAHTDMVKRSKNKQEVWPRLASSGGQRREKQLASGVGASLATKGFACEDGRPSSCRRRFGPDTGAWGGSGTAGPRRARECVCLGFPCFLLTQSWGQLLYIYSNGQCITVQCTLTWAYAL
ncbi:hypothetical protein HJG60_011623 [Phyllostomus discolor]|uniref:Uncharacterized protein n=1 Tax=Phyllostomus discolor TaxID=89673 RepID=A0A833ZW60_9CHIR|nr:hypothetical protein HJG60_011623 [Phyllostomus discolor]